MVRFAPKSALAVLAAGVMLVNSSFFNGAGAQQLAPMLDEAEIKKIEQKYPSKFVREEVSPEVEQPAAQESGYTLKEEAGGKVTLGGGVSTLDAAIQSEQGVVDWYAWYMNTREYLRGRLTQCPVGTPLQFHNDGTVQAMTMDSLCQASVSWMRIPFPKGTKITTILLPIRKGVSVRAGEGAQPPAPLSPAEFKQRLHQSDAPIYY